MDLILVGPGRAGLSVSLAAVAAGHRVIAVLARRPEAGEAAAERLGCPVARWDRPLPAADLLVVAVRDDAIGEVADRLAPVAGAVAAAVHLSGLTPSGALAGLGIPVGSFHPLQTMPTPEAGATRLDGAWVAVTCDDNLLADNLFRLAVSLGAHPFEVADDAKALYHAAAAAAANFTVTSLALSRRLFGAAGVDFVVAEPLIGAVVANALQMGPDASLTGPVARGDIATVATQVAAVRAAAPDLAEHFEALVRATAAIAGTADLIEEALR